MLLKKPLLSALILLNLLIGSDLQSEEGMFPLSYLANLDLKKAGLKISASDIFNPQGNSLSDAIVKINGCTGSFISSEGLILTNHHCAFSAISGNSTPERNYLEAGYIASNKNLELPAEGYQCKITENYEDVTSIILQTASIYSNPSDRSSAIFHKMAEIADSVTANSKGIVAEVSEMFSGRSYILFKYRIINDVRLVYAPPRAIGEFGGESDNWVWPRHTGDFSLMRAYISPDGESSAYNPDNVPFSPKVFLEINQSGTEEGDLVFLLGYPGRTYRHQPSQFLELQAMYQLPYISSLYSHLIRELESLSAEDENLKLRFSDKIKGLANTSKNYSGKIKGINRLNLVEKKKLEEKEIEIFCNSNDELKNKYRNLFSQIDSAYKPLFENSRQYFWLTQFFRNSDLAYLSEELIKICLDAKPLTDSAIYVNKTKLKKISKEIYMPFEISFMNKMIEDARLFSDSISIDAVAFLDSSSLSLSFLAENSIILDTTRYDFLIGHTKPELKKCGDPFLDFIFRLRKQLDIINADRKFALGDIAKLNAAYSEAKELYFGNTFTPDANGTFRFTYGSIKGYNPADAVYYSPFTSIQGILEKSASTGDYYLPDSIKTIISKQIYAPDNEKTENVVAMLYNTDTSGGNSGSPVLDAEGKLVGLNFDRAYEATINDFAWNESYSRSIGVDIRYILWVMKNIGNAENLIKEMNVN